MNDVFIKLYLDEDVDVLIANLIRPHGFEVVTTNEVEVKAKVTLNNSNIRET